MKKILKKNQVIITSLAVLIAVAGYLNFADVDLGLKNKEASADSSSILEDVDYDLTDETALLDENGADSSLTDVQDQTTSTPGEAVLTGASDFAAFPENRSVPRIKQTCRLLLTTRIWEMTRSRRL